MGQARGPAVSQVSISIIAYITNIQLWIGLPFQSALPIQSVVSSKGLPKTLDRGMNHWLIDLVGEEPKEGYLFYYWCVLRRPSPTTPTFYFSGQYLYCPPTLIFASSGFGWLVNARSIRVYLFESYGWWSTLPIQYRRQAWKDHPKSRR